MPKEILNDDQRRAIKVMFYRFARDKSYKEISTLTGMTPTGVSSMISRIMHDLAYDDDYFLQEWRKDKTIRNSERER